MIEAILIILIAIFLLISRFGKNDTVGSSVKNTFSKVISKIMPYNYDDVKKMQNHRSCLTAIRC